MRKFLLISSIVLVLLGFVSTNVFARSTVAFTWTATDLGQGCWGGGSMNVDGTMGGGASCAFANGQVVAVIVPSNWWPVGSSAVAFCGTMVFLKGGSGSVPTCLGPIPVTGTPIKVTFPGADGPTLIRVTPVN